MYILAGLKTITNDQIQEFIKSMPARLQAVIDTQGGHTKYSSLVELSISSSEGLFPNSSILWALQRVRLFILAKRRHSDSLH